MINNIQVYVRFQNNLGLEAVSSFSDVSTIRLHREKPFSIISKVKTKKTKKKGLRLWNDEFWEDFGEFFAEIKAKTKNEETKKVSLRRYRFFRRLG